MFFCEGKSVTEVTESATNLAEEINVVAEEMKESKSIADVLHAETERFIN